VIFIKNFKQIRETDALRLRLKVPELNKRLENRIFAHRFHIVFIYQQCCLNLKKIRLMESLLNKELDKPGISCISNDY